MWYDRPRDASSVSPLLSFLMGVGTGASNTQVITGRCFFCVCECRGMLSVRHCIWTGAGRESRERSWRECASEASREIPGHWGAGRSTCCPREGGVCAPSPRRRTVAPFPTSRPVQCRSWRTAVPGCGPALTPCQIWACWWLAFQHLPSESPFFKKKIK